MNLNPEIGISSRSSMSSIGLRCGNALQLQSYINEIVGWPGPGVLEFQPLAILSGNLVDHVIKLGLAMPFDQECGVHDHFVADWLVISGGDANAAQRFIDLANVLAGLFY